MAIAALKKGQVQKIILTRPLFQMFEAGENLGFLPGDLKKKSIPIAFRVPFMMPFINIFGMDHTNRFDGTRRDRDCSASPI